jgi:hypothetical protein
MIAYHGSSERGLTTLTYNEIQSRFGGEKGLKHGAGVYLTTSANEAKAYATGGSYYVINVIGEVFDSTNIEDLTSFVKLVGDKLNYPNLLKNKTIKELIRQTNIGVISAVNFPNQIAQVISNEESLYSVITSNFKDIDELEPLINSLFTFDLIKLRNNDSETWIICLNSSEKNLEIIEEVIID